MGGTIFRLVPLVALIAGTYWHWTLRRVFDIESGIDPVGEPLVALRRALDHLDRWPGDLDASRLAARSFSQLIYPAEAEPHYERLRRANRYSSDDAHARALGLTRSNHREEAVIAFEEILAKNPDDPLALRRLAAIHWSRGRLEDALALASRLARTPTGQLPGSILLAQVNHSLGRWEEAVAHFRHVLELDPDLNQLGQPREVFYLEFGDDLLRTGRPAEARALLESALTRLDDVGLLELLGQACLESGDIDEADRSWRRAAERSTGRAKPWRNLGRLSLRNQHPEEALAYLDRALAIEPGNYETLALLATAHKVLGRADQALEFDQRAAAARRALPPSTSGMGSDVTGPMP